jgi:hypothetical protein
LVFFGECRRLVSVSPRVRPTLSFINGSCSLQRSGPPYFYNQIYIDSLESGPNLANSADACWLINKSSCVDGKGLAKA